VDSRVKIQPVPGPPPQAAGEEILETEISVVTPELSYKMVEILPVAVAAREGLVRMAVRPVVQTVVQVVQALMSIFWVSIWVAVEADRAVWPVQVRTVEVKAAVVLTRLAHSRQAEQLEPAAAAAAVHTRSRPMQGFSNSPGMVVPVQ
jgi:hypothetical protein